MFSSPRLGSYGSKFLNSVLELVFTVALRLAAGFLAAFFALAGAFAFAGALAFAAVLAFAGALALAAVFAFAGALALVAARETGQLFRVVLAHRVEPARGDAQRLIPGDLFELTGAAFAHALQRCAQPRWGVDLHDARAALGAEHAFVHRVIPIAFDIGNLAILHMHIDAAAAGAHVAGRLANLV